MKKKLQFFLLQKLKINFFFNYKIKKIIKKYKNIKVDATSALTGSKLR